MRGLVQKPMLGDECMSDGTNPGDRNNVGKWLFNEGSGNKVFDLSGNNNDGVLSNVTWSSGKFGSALNFDEASNSNCVVSNGSNGLKQTNGAIVLWFRPVDINTGGSTDYMFSSRGDPSTRLYVMQVNADLKFGFGTTASIDSGFNIVGGILYQLVLTWDSLNYYLYVNEVLVKSGANTLNPAPSGDFNLGRLLTGTGDWSGKIENVILYSRTLTVSEIAELYREPFLDLGPRRFLPFAPAAVGGISMPVVMLQHNHFNGGMAA